MMKDGTAPMNHDPSNRSSDPAQPDDIRDVAALLDRAAAAARAEPDASFEARLAMRTRPVPARRDEVHPRTTPHLDTWGVRRTSRPLWSARVAAAFAIAGGVIAAWVGVQTTSAPSDDRLASMDPGSEAATDDLEWAFAIAGLGDDTDSSLDDLLKQASQQADSIDSTIRQGIDISDLFGEEDAT